MEKLKAKLLTHELSLQIYLRYDCQNKMFIKGLFPVGDSIKMSESYFFQLLERFCGLSVPRDQSVGSEKLSNLPLWNNLQQQAFLVQIRW